MSSERVYILGTPGSRTVKIGRTINLAKRFAEIQRMSPVPLEVLWSYPGGHELETNLHRQFSALRVHGEWFAFKNDPVALVCWAVEGESWLKPRVSLKKRIKRQPAAALQKRLPAPALSPEDRASLHAQLQPYIDRVSSALNAIEDPEERYKAVLRTGERLKSDLSARRQAIVLRLKGDGRTWSEVGALIGLTGARAEQISRASR